MKSKLFILVHGAWHAKWCWKYVEPLLIEAGHGVISVDLPGHGNHHDSFASISLATYVDHVTHLIQLQHQPVTLVGHSLAGIVISQVAENIPHKIQELIYVAAFIPEHGKSLMDEAEKNKLPGIGAEFIFDEENHAIDLKRSERINELFYHLCKAEDQKLAFSRLQKEPARPFRDPIQLTAEKFGKVQKKYIECKEDKSLHHKDQKRMHSKHGCHVIQIKADHSPFLSAPYALAKALID